MPDFSLPASDGKTYQHGILRPRGFANRWTFYINKEGLMDHIDKSVRPATSAEDMIAKVGDLKVPMNN